MKDVTPGEKIRWQECITTELTGKRNPDWLQPGDILVAARGNRNYAVRVDEELVDLGLRAVAAPHFYIVRTTRANLLPEFLTWLLNQRPCQRYFEQSAEGTLTKSIRRQVLEETPIALPSLEKQRAIIGIANTLRREQLAAQQLIQNGEQLMNAVAKDLFNKEVI